MSNEIKGNFSNPSQPFCKADNRTTKTREMKRNSQPVQIWRTILRFLKWNIIQKQRVKTWDLSDIYTNEILFKLLRKDVRYIQSVWLPIIKANRKYEVNQDWIKNKQIFILQQNMVDHTDNLKLGDIVTVIRDSRIVKGERHAEYKEQHSYQDKKGHTVRLYKDEKDWNTADGYRGRFMQAATYNDGSVYVFGWQVRPATEIEKQAFLKHVYESYVGEVGKRLRHHQEFTDTLTSQYRETYGDIVEIPEILLSYQIKPQP